VAGGSALPLEAVHGPEGPPQSPRVDGETAARAVRRRGRRRRRRGRRRRRSAPFASLLIGTLPAFLLPIARGRRRRSGSSGHGGGFSFSPSGSLRYDDRRLGVAPAAAGLAVRFPIWARAGVRAK